MAYNLTDMATEADNRLGRYRDEALSIIAKAKAEAVLIKQQARDEGRKEAAEEAHARSAQQQATAVGYPDAGPCVKRSKTSATPSRPGWRIGKKAECIWPRRLPGV